MIEGGRYCTDMLAQARAALARVEREILETHVASCVAVAIVSGDTEAQRVKIADLTELLRRAIR